MIWSLIKPKLYLGIGLLVVALLGLIKIQSARLEKANTKNRELTARDKHAKNYMEKQKEHKAENVSRTTALAKEIDEHGYTKELSEKDKDW